MLKIRILALLKMAQELLAFWKGKTASQVQEKLMEIQSIIQDKTLPNPVMNRYKPEQLYLWQKERV